MLQNWWLSVWAGQTQAAGDHLDASGLHFYLGIYSAIGLAALLSQAVRGVLMLFGMLNASRVLHADLVNNVTALRANNSVSLSRPRMLSSVMQMSSSALPTCIKSTTPMLTERHLLVAASCA